MEMEHLDYRKNFSLRVKLITWLAISIQTILPIATPFILPMAEASHQQEVFWGKASENPLPDSDGFDAATGLALGSVTRGVNNSVQQWLNRYGNARVQLDVDKSFSLKNSQLDLLIPVYEQKNSLMFAQSSLHRTDDRMQSNLGLGLRWFDDDDYMVGGNMFVDYDWSQHHVRAGAGVEYGRDFLKLSANGYRRLTDWKEANNLADYQSRPANGWDVRAETWLPVLPQLGGKLRYEQYYGNQVALHNKNDRQKDPHVFSAGINYTPIPLLTFSAEHQFAYAGKSDTRFGLQLNYPLGVAWSQQINPDAVSAMRTLVGARYDFVERNNNIVLEYRKKEVEKKVVTIKADNRIGGVGGINPKPETVKIEAASPYGIEKIVWDTSLPRDSIKPQTGDVNSGISYGVTLPNYRPNDPQDNAYTITWRAIDKKGNSSYPVTTEVRVGEEPWKLNIKHTDITPKSLEWVVGDNNPQTVTLHLKNNAKEPLDVWEDYIVIKLGSESNGVDLGVKKSTFKRQQAGVYTATFTPGDKPGSAVFWIDVIGFGPDEDGSSIGTIDVTVKPQ